MCFSQKSEPKNFRTLEGVRGGKEDEIWKSKTIFVTPESNSTRWGGGREKIRQKILKTITLMRKMRYRSEDISENVRNAGKWTNMYTRTSATAWTKSLVHVWRGWVGNSAFLRATWATVPSKASLPGDTDASLWEREHYTILVTIYTHVEERGCARGGWCANFGRRFKPWRWRVEKVCDGWILLGFQTMRVWGVSKWKKVTKRNLKRAKASWTSNRVTHEAVGLTLQTKKSLW